MPPTLTLKQRLANLSQAASGPSPPISPTSPRPAPRSSSFGALGSAISKRKAFFNPPWATPGSRAHPGAGNAGDESKRVDEVISRMIFQAGVDFETRPMVVMNASVFPDPRTISYDQILSNHSCLLNNRPVVVMCYYCLLSNHRRILSYLDLFVESDYTVVFFAAGGHHTPNWNWVWKAYRSLSRKYRKNLKRLYIVHSSFFSKMLFSLAGAIISPKFFRKITYIDTLSSLACHVPLTQIDIPPAVYSENLKHESQITLPIPTYSRMFGVRLEDLMGVEGEKDGLPRVVRDCIQYLRETGLEEEGLFRRSPSSAQLQQVREAYNRGQTVSLSSFDDPHLAAVLLKKFLRDLPEPIFPERLYDVIKRCPIPGDDHDDMAAILYMRSTLLPELPPCTLILLSNILLLLHEVSLRSDKNRMDAHNLAIVLTPNLVASGNPLKDVMICGVAGAPEPLSPGTRTAPPPPGAGNESRNGGRTTLGTLIKLCIHRYFEVFDEIADRAEAVDVDPFSVGDPDEFDAPSSTGSVSPNPPESPSNIKRQSLLHDDESIDDAMLVMPLGPNSASPTTRRFPGSGSGTQTTRGWQPKAAGGVRSVTSSESRQGTLSKTKARSLFAPTTEKGAARRGTLPTSASASATLRKAPGAGVTAHSVTASGFFTPPNSNPSLSERQNNGNSSTVPPVPPVPPLHPMSGTRRNG